MDTVIDVGIHNMLQSEQTDNMKTNKDTMDVIIEQQVGLFRDKFKKKSVSKFVLNCRSSSL